MSFACSSQGCDFLVTGADIVRCYEVAGETLARELLSYGQSALRVQSRRDGMLAASLRSASSSGSSGSGAKLCTGLTGTRLESIRKVDSWRASGGSSLESGKAGRMYSDGLCYGKLFSRSAAQSCMATVGEWPTFGSLVRLSARKFKSVQDLERFRLVSSGKGLFHVAAGGSAGVSFLDAVARYGASIKAQPGTFVSDVLQSGRASSALPAGCAVVGTDRLGGVDVPGVRLPWDLGSESDRALLVSMLDAKDRSVYVRGVEAYRDEPSRGVNSVISDMNSQGRATFIMYPILNSALSSQAEFEGCVLGFFSSDYKKLG